MESLFARKPPKRGRVILMLAGSLVLHGGLVGIAALFVQPPPPVVDIGPEWIAPEDGGPTPMAIPETTSLPEVDPVPVATPDFTNRIDDTPPPLTNDPEFADPATPAPSVRTVVRQNKTAKAGVTGTPGVVSMRTGRGPAGIPGGGSSPVVSASWVMPHPPFPAFLRQAGTLGSTKLRISTDATGRISNVVVDRSTGAAVLDSYTTNYVREHWHGPANASRTTEFVYQRQ